MFYAGCPIMDRFPHPTGTNKILSWLAATLIQREKINLFFKENRRGGCLEVVVPITRKLVVHLENPWLHLAWYILCKTVGPELSYLLKDSLLSQSESG